MSKLIDESLRAKLPEIADRCVMMENITNPRQIWDLALVGADLVSLFVRINMRGKYRCVVVGNAVTDRSVLAVKYYLLHYPDIHSYLTESINLINAARPSSVSL